MTYTTAESGPEQAEAGELTDSERHRVLADERRRALLDVLAADPQPAGLGDVAGALAETAPCSDADVEDLLVSLHHVHLPLLDDVGVLEYDPERRRVQAIRTVDPLRH